MGRSKSFFHLPCTLPLNSANGRRAFLDRPRHLHTEGGGGVESRRSFLLTSIYLSRKISRIFDMMVYKSNNMHLIFPDIKETPPRQPPPPSHFPSSPLHGPFCAISSRRLCLPAILLVRGGLAWAPGLFIGQHF